MKNVQEIVDLASAYYGSAVLFAAIDAGVFAAVEKCSDVASIAPEIKGDARGVRLLLDACVAEGLLAKDGDAYSNTPAGKAALVPGGPADLTRAIRYNRDVYPAWGRLLDFVRTGRPVEKPEIHLGEDAARTKAFAASMFGRAFGIGRGIVPMLGNVDGRILDLAGGPAAYAILMCQANPGASCVTVDLKAISAEAAGYVAQFGLSKRIECRAGDYHSDVYEAESYDAVTIFGALHQESPEMIVDILRRANAALKKGGRLYVLDMMTDSTHTAPAFSALFAVNMALTTENGWVFSDEELKGWMREAGFTPGETLHAAPPMPHWLVCAAK
ncbi:MAG: methyltransferase domain-containing protein [Lentisphaerae bacterium]|jgi:ubiquinone/menaquinone biosynthesis C-methylase UbiE|nr:methyltransferase domain-containing protein [Lentisphaerota bacterium]